MVKLSGLRGFRCRIRCNGRVLEEYEDDETQDTETTATRYVEAITGAEFAIKISTLRNFGWKTTAFTAEGNKTCNQSNFLFSNFAWSIH